MNQLISSIITLSGLGVSVGLGLAYASVKLAVEVNPLEEQLREVLPCANCGACGYAGCNSYAAAVVNEGAPINLCVPGGNPLIESIAQIMGVEATSSVPLTAHVLCRGGAQESTLKYEYQGVPSCKAVGMIASGDKTCSYGCLGYGSCAAVCPFDALSMNEDRLPKVNLDNCTGCGICAAECPRKIIVIAERAKQVDICCRSFDKGKQVKEYCQVGCIGCGMCVNVCAFEAIELRDNLAHTNYEKCTTCGICASVCKPRTINKA